MILLVQAILVLYVFIVGHHWNALAFLLFLEGIGVTVQLLAKGRL